MQLRYWMLLTALTFSGAAIAADTGERTSQVDKNSKCMDRTTDSSSGDCVVKDEGTPRHSYAPKKPAFTGTGTSPSATSPAPAQSTVRNAPAASK